MLESTIQLNSHNHDNHRSFNSFGIGNNDVKDVSFDFKSKINKIFRISIINQFENKDMLKSGHSRTLETRLAKQIELIQMIDLSEYTKNILNMAKYDLNIPKEIKEVKDLSHFNETFRYVILYSICVSGGNNTNSDGMDLLKYYESKGFVFIYAQIKHTMKNVCENLYKFSKNIQTLDLDKSNISKYILILTKYVNENCDSILEHITFFDKMTDGELII